MHCTYYDNKWQMTIHRELASLKNLHQLLRSLGNHGGATGCVNDKLFLKVYRTQSFDKKQT